MVKIAIKKGIWVSEAKVRKLGQNRVVFYYNYA